MLRKRLGGRGFTLVEMLIVVAMVAVLATLALPQLQEPIRKARRQLAIGALTQAQLEQEARRSQQPDYDTEAPLRRAAAGAVGQHYVFAHATPADATPSTGYQLMASALASSSQAGDANCQVLVLRVVGAQATRLAGTNAGSASTGAAAERCWGQR